MQFLVHSQITLFTDEHAHPATNILLVPAEASLGVSNRMAPPNKKLTQIRLS